MTSVLASTPALPSRYTSTAAPRTAEGWTLKRCTPPSRVFGANGLRTGPDGRIYIAQVTGSQISALDIGAGSVETVSPKGGDIVAPDDVAFLGDALIATEVMNGRVSVRENGVSRVLRDDVPSANGITVHDNRLFIGECRHGGRLLELTLDGSAPRVILESVPSPNAMEFGPDGLITRHRDRFDFWRWSRQALGPAGWLLGWTPLLRAKVRATAAGNLDRFLAARKGG